MTNPSEIPRCQTPKPDRDTPPRRALTLDVDLYQHYLDSSDYTDAEKREMVKAVWNIIIACIDLDIAIHPAQDFEKSCGQLPAAADPASPAQRNAIESVNTEHTGGTQ